MKKKSSFKWVLRIFLDVRAISLYGYFCRFLAFLPGTTLPLKNPSEILTR